MKFVQVKITHKAVYVNGKVKVAGDIVETSPDAAKELVGLKRAVYMAEDEPGNKKTLGIKNAGSLVSDVPADEGPAGRGGKK